MRYVMVHVEEKIKNVLPDKFCVEFDGWLGRDTHYISIFASFLAQNELEYQKKLIGLSLMEEEDSLNFAENYGYV